MLLFPNKNPGNAVTRAGATKSKTMKQKCYHDESTFLDGAPQE
jgi:hypothetical protein